VKSQRTFIDKETAIDIPAPSNLLPRQTAFGYTAEDVDMISSPWQNREKNRLSVWVMTLP